MNNKLYYVTFLFEQYQKMKIRLKTISAAVFSVLLLVSCSDNNNDDDNADTKQHITFSFHHIHGDEDLMFDTMMYTNTAGNKYLVNEIQYFVSDVKLYQGNDYLLIDEWTDIHYVDTDIESSQRWDVFDNVPVGTYDSITFTFGISEEKNQSFMFPNPPERDMFWPEFLGGGYHYMKLNGKWEEQNSSITPFDFHLGIGQVYYSYPDSIISYVHNAFEVGLPSSNFSISAGESLEFELYMNIENWFRTPNIYDHDIWGGYIMQNQEAMKLACENAHDVFSIKIK